MNSQHVPPSADLKDWNPLEVVLLPLFRSWMTVLLCGVLGAAGGTFVALLKPNEYESTAIIHYRAGAAESLPVDGPGGADVRSGGSHLNNEFHLLSSRETFRMVAEEVGPDVVLQAYDPASEDGPDTSDISRQFHRFQSWWFRQKEPPARSPEDRNYETHLQVATEILAGRTEFSIPLRTDLIEIIHKAHDPVNAQRITEAFIDVLKIRHGQVYPLTPYVDVLEKTLKDVTERVTEFEGQLQELREETQVFDFESQLAAVVTEIDELGRAIRLNEATLETRRERLADFQAKLNSVSPTRTSGGQDMLIQNPAYADALTRRNNARDELEAEKERYDPGHPDYESNLDAFRQKLNRMEDALAKTSPTLTQKSAGFTEPNPRYQELTDRIFELQGLVAELDKQIAAQRANREELLERKRSLVRNDSRVRNLVTALEEARQEQDTVHRRLEMLAIPRERQEKNESNLSVWQTPTLPFQKSGPQRSKMVLAGAFMGLVVGGGIGVVQNLLNRTVRRRKDLKDVLGVPVMSVVPVQGGWRRAQNRAKRFQGAKTSEGGGEA